jgi:primosomal protein N' (replication factor Y) (superfamily II helicase)
MADVFAEVALNIAVEGTFTYRVPKHLHGEVTPGRRVHVPFRNRWLAGHCVALNDQTDLKRVLDIIDVLDEDVLISPEMLELTRWMAEYYCCSWGQALEAVVPQGVKKGTQTKTETIVYAAGSIEEIQTQIETMGKGAKKQARVLEILASLEHEVTLPELARLANCTAGPIHGLFRKKLVEFAKRPVIDDPLLTLKAEREQPLKLEPSQKAALDRILSMRRRKKSGVVLVHGVTGSGKTEIYLQAIEKVVADGRGAIVLVPEIALTPQTVRRFKARFDHVSVLHSHLTESQRHEQWRDIRSGQTQVVVGARSAVFAPMPDLGLIVVDEEHETSFKQDKVPRYNARDVAVIRGKLENAVVVLGSATPALESYHNARTGKYEMSHLPGRVMRRPMPAVEIVDMRQEIEALRGYHFLSKRLVHLMHERLERDEQIIVFLNRRGFATYVFCTRCGWAMKCAHCDISMTYHRGQGRVICHYCGLREPMPRECPECKGETVKTLGLGTEKVEAEVRARFPEVTCERMDSDSVHGRGAHQRVLDAFRSGRVKVLVGTQMIAKGLDFPNVTLVGVVNADSALHLPDFRAGERTHQLVSQVAGRTGRGPKGGLVVVQTSEPEHYTMRTAAAHDYVAFAEIELGHRRGLHFPPFGRAARILIDGREEGEVKAAAKAMGDAMAEHPGGFRGVVHGPAPCPIERIKDRFRWHLLLLAGKWSTLRDMITAAKPASHNSRKLHVAVDIDPLSML